MAAPINILIPASVFYLSFTGKVYPDFFGTLLCCISLLIDFNRRGTKQRRYKTCLPLLFEGTAPKCSKR